MNKINNEIKKTNMAYKIIDEEGHIFVFSNIEPGGFPCYRGDRGSKIIFDLRGFKIIEKYLIED